MFAISGLAAIAGWWTLRASGSHRGPPRYRAAGMADARAAPEIRVVNARRGISCGRSLAKELRLQQIPYVLAVLYAATMADASVAAPTDAGHCSTRRARVTVLYAGFVALLIGSLSSAQERHLGTLEWQTLQPVPAWKQWAVKVAVAWTARDCPRRRPASAPGLLRRRGFGRIPPQWMVASVVLAHDRRALSLDPLPEQHERVRPVDSGAFDRRGTVVSRPEQRRLCSLPLLLAGRSQAAVRIQQTGSRGCSVGCRSRRAAALVWIRQSPHGRTKRAAHRRSRRS